MKNYKEDFIGKKFGRLTIKEVIFTKGDRAKVICLCECGNTHLNRLSRVKDGYTLSCGCLTKEVASKTHKEHGMTNTKTWLAWKNMLDRCYNMNHKSFKHYGGRGILVCDKWKNSFENFYKDVGEAPEDKSIDRINNNGNYEPLNCKWSTQSEQNSNQRPRTRRAT